MTGCLVRGRARIKIRIRVGVMLTLAFIILRAIVAALGKCCTFVNTR